jgi:hypothetical protein|tara:strand:- start:1305 stop:1523 length:219 start_codon:yes stop_codon:yes gene_type:complete
MKAKNWKMAQGFSVSASITKGPLPSPRTYFALDFQSKEEEGLHPSTLKLTPPQPLTTIMPLYSLSLQLEYSP